MLLPWVVCGALLVAVVVLFVKVLLLKNDIDELCAELREHLSNDTNTLISTSSTNRHMRSIAAELNGHLGFLRKQRQQYLSGNRALKEAVTNISHDLRTPLTAICGYLDLLESVDKSETACRYLEAIKNRTEIMKQLTEELFRYSIVASAENNQSTELVTINSVLEESIAGFYSLLQEQNIVPTIHITEEKVVRRLNRASLSRVFANLLSNAISYSDGDLDIELTEAGEITFTNTASGLDEVQVGKLFDRFYTVEAARKSTGLGLSISRSLVEQMSGSITARFVQGKLMMKVAFPLHK